MNYAEIIRFLEVSQDMDEVKEVFNMCSATINRLYGEQGLQESMQTIKQYNASIDYFTKRGEGRGWRSAEEVLDKDYAGRAAAQGLTVDPPAKRLKLKCGCLIASDTKSTVKSCGDAKHPVGRVVNIK